jgi:heme-degrading monooxygenase HmoA
MFAVIFEVEPKEERRGEYLELASFLKPALEKIDGFIEVERFANRRTQGRVLSLSTWRDEKSVIRWRVQGAHHEVQTKGRSGIFQEYHLRVGEITADTSLPDGDVPRQQRFDATETGAAKVVTLTEIRPLSDKAREPAVALEPDAAGLVGAEWFESIYNPGKTLLLASWRDAETAEAWNPGPVVGAEVRHRRVRIIRDYGMFDRREAPQYYPPAPTTARAGS